MEKPTYSTRPSPETDVIPSTSYGYYGLRSPAMLTISDDDEEEAINTPTDVITEEVDFSKKYRSSDCLIIVIGNTSSCKAYGVAKILQDNWRYANLYKNRRQLYELTRARLADRGTLGAVHIRRDKKQDTTRPAGPYIGYLMVNYSPGPAQDKNSKKNYNPHGKDTHYIEGMEKDTSGNRSAYLRKCLLSSEGLLYKEVVCRSRVKKIIFPEERTWGSDFKTQIEDFAAKAAQYGIQVHVTRRPPQGKRKTRDEDSESGEGSDCEEPTTTSKPVTPESVSDYEDGECSPFSEDGDGAPTPSRPPTKKKSKLSKKST